MSSLLYTQNPSIRLLVHSARRTLFGLLLLIGSASFAATVYWDPNGSIPGAGGTTPAGAWNVSSLFWNNATGTGAGAAWDNSGADTAVFAAGTDASGAYTVTLNAGTALNLSALQVNLGSVTLAAATGSDLLNFGAVTGTIQVAGGAGLTISAPLNGSAGITKTGTGTLTLTGTHTYTGTTTVGAGTLVLDFSAATAPAANIISSASGLALNGGTLTLLGKSAATNSQTFSGLAVGSGANGITLTQNAATSLTVALGAITQSAGGTLNFSVAPLASGIVATTSNSVVNGILGPWATVGTGTATQYATITGGSIVGFTGTAATANLANVTSATTNYTYSAAATLAGARTANTLQYTGAATTTALAANTLTLNGLLHTGTGTLTVSRTGAGGIQIGATNELIILGPGSVTINAPIANNGANASSLTYSGTGTLTLGTAVSTYTGTTTVNSGTLALALANVLNSASSIVINGGTLGIAATAQSVNAVSLKNGSITGTGTLTSATTFNLDAGSVSAILAGSVGLNKSGGGTLTLSGASTFTGATTINAGTINYQNATAFGTSSAITVASGATVQVQGGIAGGSLGLSLGGGGAAGATGALQSVSGNNSYAGLITLTAATTLSSDTAGNSLTLSNTGTITGSGFTLTLAGAGDGSIAGSIGTGSGSLIKTGAGNWTLSGTNTFTGSTSIFGGTLTLDDTTANNDKISPTAALTLSGGTLAILANASADSSQTVLSTALSGGASTITLTKNSASNNVTLNLNTITRSASDTLNIIYGGTGSGLARATTDNTNTSGILGAWATVNGTDWAVNSTNAADGAITALASYVATTWAAGNNTDAIISASVANNTATNSVRFNTAAAVTLTLNGAGNHTINSGGILVTPNVGSFTSTITGTNLRGPSGGTLFIQQYNPSGDLVIASPIVDNTSASSLVKTGPGVLVLSGANTFTGGVIVNQGTLSIGTIANGGTSSNLGAGTTLTLGSGTRGGTLLYTGATASTNRAVTLGGIAGGTVRVTSAASTLTLAGAIGGTGSLTKAGDGGLTLSGANTFTGGTTLLGGTLTLDFTSANSSKLDANSTLTLGGGSLAFTANASADSTQSVLGTTLSNGASTLTVTKNAASGNATLNLNTITRSGAGTINFVTAGTGTGVASITTDNTNTSGILGGWATLNGTDWAVNATNAADGAITALASYYTTATGGTTAANYASQNVDVTTSVAPGALITPNTLRFNTAAANTLTLSASTTNTLGSGGILVTANVGANLSTIAGGTIRGAANGDLVIHQFNTAAGLTISSIIGNNTSTRVVKTGAGDLTLTGVNTFTGGLVVNQGTVLISGTGAIANNAANTVTINNGGTLKVDRESFLGNYNVAINTPIVINAGGTLTNNGAQYNTLGAFTLNGGTLNAIGGRNNNFQSWGLLGTVTVTGDIGSTISGTGSSVGVQLGQATVTSVTFNVGDGAAATDLLISTPLKNGRTSANDGFIASSLVKTGSGTLVSSGANTFTGDVTVNDGTLSFTGTNTIGGNVTVNGGTLILANATTGIANGVTVNGGSLLVTAALSNVATNTITVNSGGSYVFGAGNVYGGHTATPLAPIVINAGGTVTNNGAFFSALGSVTLNGGTLTSIGGNSVNFPSWGLKGTVTVNGGAVTSTISASGTNAGVALGSADVTGAIFDVADGAAATDLLINAVLSDGRNTANTAFQASSLTKTGAGLLQLTAANTYSGATNINAGTLVLSSTGSFAASPTINLASGAILDVTAKSGGLTIGAAQTLIGGRSSGFANDVLGSLVNAGVLSPGGDGTAATLTISSGLTLQDGGRIRFDFGADGTVGGGVNDLISVAGALNATGITTILAPSSVPVSGVTYTLITTGSAGSFSAANFAFGSTGTRQTYSFDTTTTPGSLLLTATGSAANLTWTGAVNSTWDVSTTTNWSGAPDQTFFNLDNVTFNDSSAVGAVTLAANVQPLSITVNNSLAGTAYTFSGSGVGITGTTGILKEGTGTLTLSASNSFTGTVEIQQGTVNVDSVSNAGIASSLGAGSHVIFGAATTHGTLRFTPSTTGSTNKNVTVQAGGGTLEVTDAAGVLTLSGLISGSGPLSKTGTGTLVLSNGGSSYSGTLTVSAGTLKAGTAGTLGGAGGATVIESGATLDVNGFNLGLEPVSIAGTGVGDTGALINSSATAQGSALRFVTLTGDATIGGTGAWGLSGTGSPGTSTFDLGGFTLTKSGSNTITLTSTLVTDGDIVINQGALNVSLGATIAGTGTITINPGGSFGSGQNGTANTVTRAIILAGGTLANTQNSSVASAITLASGTTSAITNTTASGSYNVTGGFSGAGSLNIIATSSGGTTITTVAGNTVGGSLSNSGATLNLAGTGTVGTLTVNGATTLNGGTLRYDLSNNPASGNDQFLIGGSLTLSGTTTINVNAISSSLKATPGSYTLIGGGTSITGDTTNLALTGLPANIRQTFTLDTTTTPGSALLNVSGSIGDLTWAGPGAWDTNTTQNWNSGAEKFYTWDRVTFDDTSANGAVPLTSTVTPASVTVNNSSTAYTIGGSGGAIAGFGSLLKDGSGVLTLSNANTFTGGAVIRAGEVRVTVAGGLGAGTVTLGDASTGANNVSLYIDTNRTSFVRPITVTNNGTGIATLGTRSTVTGTGNGNGFTNVTLQRDVVLDSNAADQTNYSGISGTGNITIQGTGRTLFNGANTFIGDITVAATGTGYLQLGANTAGGTNYIPDTSSVTVNSGARLVLSVGGESIDALNGAGTVNATGVSSTLTVGASGGSGSFSGTLANNTNTLALVKAGGGTQILSGASTYSAGTTVSGGTLVINNSSGSGTGTGDVIVASGAVLGGNGFITPASGGSITINGTLTVGSTGDVAGQDLALALSGAGTLSLNGAVQLNLFSNAGTGTLNTSDASDQLIVGAASWDNVLLGGSSTLTVTTALAPSSFVAGDSWKLFDWSGILTGTAPAEGTNGFATIDLPALGGGFGWDLSQLFTTGVITVSGVPEPGRAALLLIGLTGLLSRRRRQIR